MPAAAARIPQLERLNATPGTRVVFYDPTGSQHGLHTYPWKWAPTHLKTRRQLTALGLRPGGQTPVAQILWRKGGRVAYLYDVTRALPKRKPTGKQLAALDKATRARLAKRSAS
ncbi:RRQRL motif-containing zinc-binding protein [Nonomuraea ceibae]|uniref:RRQRL motif-containing zinc-binding protein n=1 Tax=Nonomuraea ceibae TaxID=1935170 RepID=UPI001C5E85CD|nr:RRQRL motif-containing zinc-binding protein [Nonomuraea ceibae]